jgi:hypothetical protein
LAVAPGYVAYLDTLAVDTGFGTRTHIATRDTALAHFASTQHARLVGFGDNASAFPLIPPRR